MERKNAANREMAMKNPWTKKNPFLSMWLSGANAVAGAARSRMTAEANRQAATMMSEGVKQMTRFWTALLTPPRGRGPKQRR